MLDEIIAFIHQTRLLDIHNELETQNKLILQSLDFSGFVMNIIEYMSKERTRRYHFLKFSDGAGFSSHDTRFIIKSRVV